MPCKITVPVLLFPLIITFPWEIGEGGLKTRGVVALLFNVIVVLASVVKEAKVYVLGSFVLFVRIRALLRPLSVIAAPAVEEGGTSLKISVLEFKLNVADPAEAVLLKIMLAPFELVIEAILALDVSEKVRLEFMPLRLKIACPAFVLLWNSIFPFVAL